MKRPNTENSQDIPKKGIPLRVVAMGAGAIVVVIAFVVLGNTVFSEEFWQLRELDQNQVKWESQQITHYRMSIDYLGSTLDTIHVEVDNGKVISMVDSLGNKLIPAECISYACPDTLTIPGLFSFARKTIWDRLATIENISYDPAFGYPERLYISPYPEPCCQGFIITIRDFEIVSSP